MDRRHFLRLGLTLIAAGPMVARADDSFDAFRREQARAFGDFTRKEEDEYQAYVAHVNQGLELYKQEVTRALKAYRGSIAQRWSSVETSDKKRWVEYSRDMSVRRTVDFEHNEIRISVQGAQIQEARKVAEQQLQAALAEQVETAAKRDPVTAAVERIVTRSAPAYVEDKALGGQLVLGELFDQAGPTRHAVDSLAKRLMKGARTEVRPSGADGKEAGVATIVVPLPDDRVMRKARQYAPEVSKQSRRWGVDAPLVYAVIHTESSFNPLAQSPIPAYGLMQIVPGSAGRDASQAIFGRPRILTPAYLYEADNNIQAGAAYLHVLKDRYLKDVNDPKAQMYLSIAAYNTGIGNVALTVTGQTDLVKLAATVNSWASKKVYEWLLKKLPFEETRNYLARVTKRIQTYKNAADLLMAL